MAEARIGAELSAAQERGEVAAAGGDKRSINVRAADSAPATLPEIGIPRQRAAEYKALAVAGKDAISISAAGEDIGQASNPIHARIWDGYWTVSS